MIPYDDFIDKLKCELKVATEKDEDRKRQREYEKIQESFGRRMEEEMKMEKIKMSMNRKTYEIREKFVPSENRAAIVKLQKLFCLNFMGTTLGWF